MSSKEHCIWASIRKKDVEETCFDLIEEEEEKIQKKYKRINQSPQNSLTIQIFILDNYWTMIDFINLVEVYA